jgi:hypothetical protein
MKKSAARRPWGIGPVLLRFLCALVALVVPLFAPVACAQEKVLIVAVAANDEAAAHRVQELLDEPAILLLSLPAVAEPRGLLAAYGAAYVLLLDSAAARVQVVAAHGAQHTRSFPAGAQVTPYETAFVATELLGIARQEAPRPAPVAARRLQVAGRAALELAGFYHGLTMARPSLALDLRALLGARSAQRLVLGAVLGFPGRHEREREGVELTLVRWDAQLRAGFAAELAHARILALVDARLARAGVEWSGGSQGQQHGTSLGLGAAFEVELVVNPWFGFFSSLGFDVMARYNLYRVGDLVAFHEQRVAWNTLVGAVFTSPARTPPAPRTPRAPAPAY